MVKFVRNSIGAKVVLVAGVSIAGVMLVSNVYLVAKSRERVSSLVMGQARLEAEKISQQINGNLGVMASATRTMAGVLKQGHEGGFLDRKQVNAVLKANLEEQPTISGAGSGRT